LIVIAASTTVHHRLSLIDRPVSEMTYTVSSGTLNCTIPYHTLIDRPNANCYFVSILCVSATGPFSGSGVSCAEGVLCQNVAIIRVSSLH